MKVTNTTDVYQMMQAYAGSAALNTALEFGLFWMLAEQSNTAEGLAQALNIPPNRCQYWLEVLVEMGLLERTDGMYLVSQVTRTAILEVHSQETWAFRARYRQEQYPAILDLSLHIQQPVSVWIAQGREPPNDYQRLRTHADWAARFTCMGYEYHLKQAAEIAATLDMTGVQRMIDLGGGSGVVSLALLERYPQLTSVVVDFEHVCAAGREIADVTPVADRITYLTADFINDELPSGFDLALECEVGIFNVPLFRKVHALLNPNGRIVLVAPWAPGEGLPPVGEIQSSFLGTLNDPDFQYTVTAVKQSYLVEAGFRHFSERTLSNGRFLLEAWKG